MSVYAIIIAESEYPCGNVFGIFTTLEKATSASLTIKNLMKNEELENCRIVGK